MGDNIKIIECKTYKERKDFLDFPKKIYENEYCPQDYKTEKQLLEGTHPLSTDFKVMPILAYQTNCDKDYVLARCIITIYENDNKAYIGLFDAIDNTYIYLKFLKEVENKCRELGKNKMIGPVDASFWINYRFKYKSDIPFKQTYTGEPYNKENYVRMWLEAGFNISDTYLSNMYRQVFKEDSCEKHKLRLRQMKDKGYVLRNSSLKTFDNDIVDIHRLIIQLYNKFPAYKNISLIQFKKMFGYLKYVLNYSMVWLVEKDNCVVAFFICVPNYSEINKIDNKILKLIKMLKIRRKPEEYVMLYVGADNRSLGVGSALAEVAKTELYNYGCTSIGALTQKTTATNTYYKNLIINSTEYVLLEKEI